MATTPTCPKCSTALPDDYGMVTCPSCAVVLFVDMEGVAHAAGDEPQPVAEATPFVPELPAVVVEDEGGAFDLGAFQPPGEALGASSSSAQEEPPAHDMGQVPMASDQEAPAAELNMEAFLGYGGSGADSDSSQIDANDPLGISAYANSELSSAKDGSLVVTVTISGIDTKDLRTEIRQALQDSRFGWDASAVMSTVRGGMLRLERISPVKATIVINRIKNLAVQIRWEQSAITELDISEPDSTT